MFEQDLDILLSRLTSGVSKEAETQLIMLKEWLVKLQSENVVKINHSVMELVCAKYLIMRGYEVQIEYPVNEVLTCDLYSVKGYGNLIVEIETGFIPPDHALDPLTYTSARWPAKLSDIAVSQGNSLWAYLPTTFYRFHQLWHYHRGEGLP